MCLIVAAGAGAAYECGDLRLAHGLPVTRTMNKARAPVLLYNSQHAQPYPIVAANVRLPAGSTVPTSVTATLFVNDVQQTNNTWPGSQWTAGATRRIALGFDAVSLPTAIYTARLEVSFVYGSTTQTTSTTQDLVIVNRSASKYRPGWWPAGLEQIYGGRGDGRVLWVGGDGSTRIYTPVSGTAWAAPSLTRPDTLLWRADLNLYQRKLPGGTSVWYGPGGQHIQTSNRIGQTTDFAYNGDLSLASITLPAAGGPRPVYSFLYTGQQLTGVTAPGSRTTAVAYDANRRVILTDPDGRSTSFYYNTADWRISRRVDRRGTTTLYTYTGTRLTQTRLYMAGSVPGAEDPITSFRPAETLGLNGAAALDTTLVYTLLDGPRADPVGDTTAVWQDGRGAPWKIRNALGAITRVYRTDSRFPALPTRMVAPGGTVAAPDSLVSYAWYSARGNVDSVKVMNPLGDGQNARTKYTYGNAAWPDFPTSVTGPAGDSVRTGYDGNGNALWQEDSRGPVSRVNFTYYGAGPWHGMPASSQGPLTRPDSIYYDATLGNLSATRSPLGWRTTVATNAFGADTLVISPIDSTHVQTVLTKYDAMGRDSLVLGSGPAMPYSIYTSAAGAPAMEAEWTKVETFYDENGQVKKVLSSASPVVRPTQATEYTYDRAGRITEDSVPGKLTHRRYDPAGNVTDAWNNRNLHTRTDYDALNRPVIRRTDLVVYPATTCEGHPDSPLLCQMRFPLYPNNDSGGLTILGDVATFSYDPMTGALLAAHNRWARVDRTYYPNGQLRTDTLRIRAYGNPATGPVQPVDGSGGCQRDPSGEIVCPTSGGRGGVELASAGSVAGDSFPDAEFTSHVYGLAYAYDIGGKLTRLDHPANLAPGSRHTDYQYAAYSALSGVDDVLGNHYSFLNDAEGRPARITYPGGVVDTTAYDDDGRRVMHSVRGSGYSLSGELLSYDARGKVLLQTSTGGLVQEQTENHYSGLGTLVASAWGAANTTPSIDEYRSDPLGRMYWSRSQTPQSAADVQSFHYTYAPGTSALSRKLRYETGEWGSTFSPDTTYNELDAAGNVVRNGVRTYRKTAAGWDTIVARASTNSYYDANDRLAFLQKYGTGGSAHEGSGTFDEYRYDALGRRVLTRSRRDSLCTAGNEDCESSIQRTVWDGDQILYEIRGPAPDSASVSTLEWDHPLGTRFGVVAYTHAGGIDAPLSLVRIESGASLTIPHANYRGVYHAGTTAGGSRIDCQPGTGCTPIYWPAPYQGPYYRGGIPRGGLWIGSLVMGQKDASGLMYRRHRYYNPATGQFTQSDPIGIAGGLNTYGFASGDPVGYSDPYGLCPYEGEERTASLDDCENDDRKAAFVALRDHAGELGAQIIDSVAAGGYEVHQIDAQLFNRICEKHGIADGACSVAGGDGGISAIYLRAGVGVARNASNIGHEVIHLQHGGQPGFEDEAQVRGFTIWGLMPGDLRAADRQYDSVYASYIRDPIRFIQVNCSTAWEGDC